MLTKGAIYYTDNNLFPFIMDVCQEQIKKAWTGKLVSVSLKPINFGQNIVLPGLTRSYPTMVKQITAALSALDTDIVFFLEHDVLYHPSHFDFVPEKEDIYYYNGNNWRWPIKEEFAITYDDLKSLSQLCCYRKTALSHYRSRLKHIEENELEKVAGHEPRWVRALGYEPGTKPRRKGGFTDETHEIWKSILPNIDIRHRRTFSPPKYTLDKFVHKPANWQQVSIDNIPYWNLRDLYNKWINHYVIK